MELQILNNWSDPLNSLRNELIFHGRNKNYGAYQIRKEYSKTLIISSLITLLVVGLFLTSFNLSHSDKVVQKVISNEQIQIEPVSEKEILPPPPPQIKESPQVKTTKFIETEIVDEEVDEEIKTQESLESVKVGTNDVSGSDEIVIPENVSVSGPVESVKEEPFTIVEEMPSFEGGEVSLMRWIQSHVSYPQYEKESDISGRVFVRFVVNVDGSVSDVQVVRGISRGLDAESIRVIKSMPKWNPGRQGGRPVPVYFNLPINFVLN